MPIHGHARAGMTGLISCKYIGGDNAEIYRGRCRARGCSISQVCAGVGVSLSYRGVSCPQCPVSMSELYGRLREWNRETEDEDKDGDGDGDGDGEF